MILDAASKVYLYIYIARMVGEAQSGRKLHSRLCCTEMADQVPNEGPFPIGHPNSGTLAVA